MSEYWLVTLPNGPRSAPSETLERVRMSVAARGKEYADFYPVAMPRLPISSLDTLMSLSDAMAKVDREIEGVVGKVEKQYKDTAGDDREPLLVDGMMVNEYVQRFEWNFAKYSVRADVKLADIMEEIRRGVAAADEEIRTMTVDFNETTQRLASLKRKKAGGLTTAPLEEFLTAAQVGGVERVDADSEYLTTLLVLVPYNQEDKWLSTYQSLCPTLAGYGGPDWLDGGSFGLGTDDGNFGPESGRQRKKGSPVVPRSSKKFAVVGDTAVYTVTILKGQYEAGFYEGDEWQQGVYVDFVEPFKRAAKENRFTVRDFEFDPSRIGETERAVEDLEITLSLARRDLVERCKVQFSETFEAMMHSKLVRAFVESVLHYGLVQSAPGEPPQTSFVSVLMAPSPRHLAKLSDALAAFYKSAAPGGPDGALGAAEDDEDEEEDYTPYVCLKFNVSA
mmetsp:Transcript_28439/g.91045  ORF Transcript_28439/g.91045 Transcript_28439/m.91045 type:complete len:449 (-) Transcript_28439:149-1495(-)